MRGLPLSVIVAGAICLMMGLPRTIYSLQSNNGPYSGSDRIFWEWHLARQRLFSCRAQCLHDANLLGARRRD